ncbi:MAG: 2,3-bisphosphoglycerate-independent phosphoglycerate mutase [Candidatus Omnitrophica bacterium]|nr:2,3-bisphosphoglycerate-independent phosphoglycerate mutase [Candidatus Omnitrophota bacterium]
MELNVYEQLKKTNTTKIVMLVMDGIGGLPFQSEKSTALERARTPNLDRLAAEAICGLHEPVGPGITPGSGPAHLALFGYDPLRYQVGRGVLAASGINFDLTSDDVAARGNFCTVDEKGIVTDRRAGRISTEKNAQLCELLGDIELPGVEVHVRPVKEHRFLLVLRGKDLCGAVSDTDPQETGARPLEAEATEPCGRKSAGLVNEFCRRAREILKDHHPANMALLRGFAKCPQWPSMSRVFGIRGAAIAGYPMYRGLAKLLGMEVRETGSSLEEEFATLSSSWSDYDFFYVHVKKTDSAGEDGNFAHKVDVIEQTDRYIPGIRELNPDVLLVTGDHSTPAAMKYHSWHPVPVLLWSRCCRPDAVAVFSEKACVNGGLGPRISATALLPLALANAERLEKFGA